jgi:hypothetical protein
VSNKLAFEAPHPGVYPNGSKALPRKEFSVLVFVGEEPKDVEDRIPRAVVSELRGACPPRRGHPGAEAFRYPHGDGWASVTWQQVDDRVRQISAGLISLGIAPRIGSRWHRRCDTNGSSSTSP